MRRRLLATSAALASLLLVPAAAYAAPDPGAFFPAEPIDGPADIQSLGGLDVARDGTGGLVYVKGDRIFASRLVAGAWQPAEQLDGPVAGPSSQPVIAAADGGRLAIAFVAGGAVWALVRPAADQPFTAPQLLAANGSNPSIDLSINGVSYVSFSTPGGGGNDVVVARKERDSSTFAAVAGSLDIDPTRDAGSGTGRSRVAVAADGVALVVWGEGGSVYARRVFEQRLSLAPQDVAASSFQGHPGAAADVPDVAVEDDSSFAWVVLRQLFEDGAGGYKTRAIGRRLLGSQFEAPEAVDGLGFPIADGVGPPRVALSGKGAGYAASATSNTAFGSVLKDDVFAPGVGLGLGTGGSVLPVAAVDQSGDGVIAWQNADSTIHARAYDNVPESRRPQDPAGDVPLSTLAAGPSDAARGLEAASNRVGDTAIAFVLGSPGARYIVVASFDRRPGPFRLSSSSVTWRNVARVPLRWGTSLELWGGVTYRVEINGRVVGETTSTSLALPALPDGVHRWRVTATDRRGQVVGTGRRVLRHDGTAPRARFAVSGSRRRGRPVRVRVRASDAHPAGRRASGVRGVRISFGDGAQSGEREAVHGYRRAGRYTVRVSVRDRANNITTVRRRITIR
jgi:hypothetical protein